MGFDPRAAVGEALRNGVGTKPRANGSLPRKDSASQPAERAVTPSRSSRRPKASGSRLGRADTKDIASLGATGKSQASPGTTGASLVQLAPAVVGVRRGNRRVLDLNLGREARAMLKDVQTGRTRTEIVLEAIEETYEQIVKAHGRERTGLFAAAGRPAERRRVEDPRKVVVAVSEAEAEVIAEVLDQTTLSLSAFVDEALCRVGKPT